MTDTVGTVTPASTLALTRRRTRQRKQIQRAILIALEILLAAVVLIPFIWMVGISIKPESEPYSIPAKLWPDNPTLDNYAIALNPDFIRYAINSTIVSILTIIISITTGLLAAYSFTRLNFPGRRLLLIGIIL